MYKIAFVGNSALTMMNFRLGVMKELSRQYEVVMITPQDCELTPLAGTSIRFVPIEVDCRGTNPFKDIRLYRQLKTIYSREHFDFVFHYTIKPVIYGSMVAGTLGVKYISVVTGLGYTFIKRNWLFRLSCLLHRKALCKAQEVWFLNDDDQNVFVDLNLVHPNKTHVIPGEGIDTTFFSTQQPLPNEFTFMFCGRMLRYKGVELFVQAAERLQTDYPTAHWQLLGPLDAHNPDGVKPNEMEDWVKKGFIEYLGVAKDVRPYLKQCSCLVLPSYFREGVPRSLMEAAAMERPIIATNSVGCKDVVLDGVNGLLCEKRSIEGLVDAMRKILEMPAEKLRCMGKKGRELILRKFDEKIVIKEYETTLHRHLNG